MLAKEYRLSYAKKLEGLLSVEHGVSAGLSGILRPQIPRSRFLEGLLQLLTQI
jgi:hypothetical protein